MAERVQGRPCLENYSLFFLEQNTQGVNSLKEKIRTIAASLAGYLAVLLIASRTSYSESVRNIALVERQFRIFCRRRRY